jgi:hypothetical protein
MSDISIGRMMVGAWLRRQADRIESGDIGYLRDLNEYLRDFISQHDQRIQLPEYADLRHKHLD